MSCGGINLKHAIAVAKGQGSKLESKRGLSGKTLSGQDLDYKQHPSTLPAFKRQLTWIRRTQKQDKLNHGNDRGLDVQATQKTSRNQSWSRWKASVGPVVIQRIGQSGQKSTTSIWVDWISSTAPSRSTVFGWALRFHMWASVAATLVLKKFLISTRQIQASVTTKLAQA